MKKLTILTIDDDPDILTLVDHLLAKKNYNVIRAESGRKALEILRERHDFLEPEPASREDLLTVHSREYVNRIKNARGITEPDLI